MKPVTLYDRSPRSSSVVDREIFVDSSRTALISACMTNGVQVRNDPCRSVVESRASRHNSEVKKNEFLQLKQTRESAPGGATHLERAERLRRSYGRRIGERIMQSLSVITWTLLAWHERTLGNRRTGMPGHARRANGERIIASRSALDYKRRLHASPVIHPV